MALTRVRRAYEKFGIGHVLLRGLEFLLLQTKPTAAIYWGLAPKYYQWWYSRRLQQFDDSLRAFDLHYVDPDNIQRLTSRGRPSEGTLNDIGVVIDGEWDKQRCPPDEHSLFYAAEITDTLLYQAMEARYISGREWDETKFYNTVVDIVENGDTEWHGCTSVEDVNQKCEYVDYLYREFENGRYKTQMELREGRPAIDEPFGYMNTYLMEVAVDVTRDGELLLVDGRHRLYLAQLLGLDHIPVTIIARHEKWVEQMCESDAVSESELLEQRS